MNVRRISFLLFLLSSISFVMFIIFIVFVGKEKPVNTNSGSLNTERSKIEFSKEIHTIGKSDVKKVQDLCYVDTYEKKIKKYGMDILLIDGIEVPEETTSYHYKLPLFSKRFKRVRLLLLKTLFIFHHYCETQNILYTLATGNLISYLRDSRIMLPWDDDIDVSVSFSQWNFIENIWDELGFEETITKDGKWLRRKVYLFEGVMCYMYKPKRIENPKHYRLKFQDEISVDVDKKYNYREGCMDIFAFSERWAPGKLDSFEDYEVSNICGIQVRVPSDRKLAEEWCYSKYCSGYSKYCVSPISVKRHRMLQNKKETSKLLE